MNLAEVSSPLFRYPPVTCAPPMQSSPATPSGNNLPVLSRIYTLQLSMGFPMGGVKEPSVGVWKAYTLHPTEATVGCSVYAFHTPTEGSFTPPIGKPIDNCSVYILDSTGKLLPEGVAGELCIGGAQVTGGYLNNGELTSARFIPDKFHPLPGAKIYRT